MNIQGLEHHWNGTSRHFSIGFFSIIHRNTFIVINRKRAFLLLLFAQHSHKMVIIIFYLFFLWIHRLQKTLMTHINLALWWPSAKEIENERVKVKEDHVAILFNWKPLIILFDIGFVESFEILAKVKSWGVCSPKKDRAKCGILIGMCIKSIFQA